MKMIWSTVCGLIVVTWLSLNSLCFLFFDKLLNTYIGMLKSNLRGVESMLYFVIFKANFMHAFVDATSANCRGSDSLVSRGRFAETGLKYWFSSPLLCLDLPTIYEGQRLV